MRKFPLILDEVEALVTVLKVGETPGKRYKRLGGAIWQTRLPNRSAKTGKRGGFRVLYHVSETSEITLLTVHLRREFGKLTDTDIQRFLKEAGL